MVLKRAGVRLRDWLRDERRTQQWLAEQLGTVQTNISAWMRGRPIPLEAALGIQKVTGIEVEEWVVEAEAAADSVPPPTA